SAEVIPLRTRCFASWQARSGRPTIANGGQPVLQVRLDLDAPGVKTDERMGDRPCEHLADASGEGVTCLSRLRAGCDSTDDHVLEVLAGPSARPSVDVPPVPPLLT